MHHKHSLKLEFLLLLGSITLKLSKNGYFRPMSDHEWFLFVMLLVLIATFLIVYFNPLENPLTEKKVETNDFPAADQFANDF